MTVLFAGMVDSSACQLPASSAGGNWRLETTDSVECNLLNVRTSARELNDSLSARIITSRIAKPAALLNLLTGVLRSDNKTTEINPMTGHRKTRMGTPRRKPSVEVSDDELVYQHLNRSQKHWLYMEQNFGAWLVRISTRP